MSLADGKITRRNTKYQATMDETHWAHTRNSDKVHRLLVRNCEAIS